MKPKTNKDVRTMLAKRMIRTNLTRYKLAENLARAKGGTQKAHDAALARMLNGGLIDFNRLRSVCDALGLEIIIQEKNKA